MEIVNTCGDAQSQINIQPIEDEVNEGLDELNIMYVTLWICWALAMLEFVVWVIFGAYTCMNRVERSHMDRNCSDSKPGVKYVAVQPAYGQQQP